MSLQCCDEPRAVNKMKPDAQKVTDCNNTACMFSFLSSRNLAAILVEYGLSRLVGRRLLTSFT